MKILLIIVILTGLLNQSSSLMAQNKQKPENVNKNLIIYKDPMVDTFINRITNSGNPDQTLKGYRVQIYSGSNRIDANKVKSDFLETYLGEKIYFEYKQPYYKVRVGDYRTKLEAQKMYQLLLLDIRFKGVLIVPDDINFPELKSEKP
jgi:hypothetical protein